MNLKSGTPRLCEVLGVEPMECFGSEGVKTKYRINTRGEMQVNYGSSREWEMMADQEQLQNLINNGIVKKAQITTEQLRDLKWLHEHFKATSLYCDHNGVYIFYDHVAEQRYLIDHNNLARLFRNGGGQIDILEAIRKEEV